MSTGKAPMRDKKDKKNTKRPSHAPSHGPNHGSKTSKKGHHGYRGHDAKGASSAAHSGSYRSRQAPDSLKSPFGSYFLWGHHALGAALANPKRKIKKLYATADAKEKFLQQFTNLPQERVAAMPDIQIVDRHQLDSLSDDGTKAVHQGLAAAVMPLEPPYLEDVLAELPDDQPVRVMVLDQVSDPRNIGAIMRSARAFGTCAIIVQDRHAPEETGTLARTAVGAIEDVAMIRVVNLARALDSLKEAGFMVAGLDMGGTTDTKAARSASRLALVMGSEGKGMRRLTTEACDQILAIAMADSSESLNVSVAAAIIMHSTQYDAE